MRQVRKHTLTYIKILLKAIFNSSSFYCFHICDTRICVHKTTEANMYTNRSLTDDSLLCDFLGEKNSINLSEILVNSTTSELLCEEPISHFIEYKYAKIVRRYGTLLPCVIGVFGNILCMFILFKKHYRSISCYLYFGFIAIADNILLIDAAIYQYMVDFSPRNISDPFCRVANAVWFGSSFASTYILFFATIDR